MKIVNTTRDKSNWSRKTLTLWEIECKLREELMLVLKERVKSQVRDNKKHD